MLAILQCVKQKVHHHHALAERKREGDVMEDNLVL